MNGNALIDAIKKGEPDDAIWQAAIDVSEGIKTDFDDVWNCTLTAISTATHADTFAAIGTCLLEHLLEHDFSTFDRLESEIRGGSDKCLYTLSCSRKLGSATLPEHSARWDSVLRRFMARLRTFEEQVEKEEFEGRRD